jgi:hypothetical protein
MMECSFQELPCRVHFLQIDMELGVETSSSKLMQFPSNINIMEATDVILRKFSHLDAMGNLEELSLFALVGEVGAERHEMMLSKARLFSYRHPAHSVCMRFAHELSLSSSVALVSYCTFVDLIFSGDARSR